MASDPVISYEEYIKWAVANLEIDFSDPTNAVLYRTNTASALNAVQDSVLFRSLPNALEKANEEYKEATGTDLLMARASDVKFFQKSYESIVDKTYRLNVLRNGHFPSPPEDGWVTPENWYIRINDIIRGTVVCKFIDGPEFLAGQLVLHAKTLGLDSYSYSQERDEGYYAFHQYTRMPIKVVDRDWHERPVEIELEVQVTTQLQEVIKQLTHTFYATTRLDTRQENGKWKWEFKTNRFRAGYLSHTLHLLEAMILEIREASMAPNGGHNDPTR